ncbi:unnamed protein product [Rhizophagus irregularis]|uniref:Uncharacterized protein n=1 Tax=Rhizophagus irregularis TaxID=588596 RepID=A0A2I1H7N5_9GLOM|nr:hypothetical protein RhiirA4_473925 [Rhizophagus irregularis]CAB4406223.1 unnamed protein product [Rhizophagus irregularis]
MDTNFVNKEDIIYEDDLIELPNGIVSESEEDTEIYITKHITVKTIIHSLVPIEYPPTSERGIAIIYYIEGWENKEAAFSDVQYSMGRPGEIWIISCLQRNKQIVRNHSLR